MTLEEILNIYNETRSAFKHFLQTASSRDALLDYQNRFTNLKADLRPIQAEVTRNYTLHDDKAATSKKYRLCIAIAEGSLRDNFNKTIYPQCSINQAEKYASGSKEYAEFIENRAFWKESLINVSSLRDDINSYLIEISNRLK